MTNDTYFQRLQYIIYDVVTTTPDVGYFSALLIFNEIGDIQRFPSARKLCSYAGLVPPVHSSGGKTRYGSITKQGSRWLRWILVETSKHYVKGSPRLKRLYDRTVRRHGKNTARVAIAREMLSTGIQNSPFIGIEK